MLDQSLNVYAGLALLYLLLPIAIILLFSFNDTQSRFNFIWQGFTLEHWQDPFEYQGPHRRAGHEHPDRGARDADRDGARHADGARARALPVPRPRATNLFIFLPLATPEVVLGASLLSLFISVGLRARLHDDPDRARDVQHRRSSS